MKLLVLICSIGPIWTWSSSNNEQYNRNSHHGHIRKKEFHALFKDDHLKDFRKDDSVMADPTQSPSAAIVMTSLPTANPTFQRTTESPTASPTTGPTAEPTNVPTSTPTTNLPITASPTATPTALPNTPPPSPSPSLLSSSTPTAPPNPDSTTSPTNRPTSNPTTAPTLTPTWNPTTCQDAKRDVILLLDRSNSVADSDYTLLQEYIVDTLIPEIFPASPNTRIGVFSFAYHNPNGGNPDNRFRVVYNITSTPADGNRTDLNQAVLADSSANTATGTATRRALQEANDALATFSQEGSRRSVILFTDGVPYPPGDGTNGQGVCLSSNREELNPLLSFDRNITLLVVALDGFNPGPIRCLIEPGDTNLFSRSFQDIASITEAVGREICS